MHQCIGKVLEKRNPPFSARLPRCQKLAQGIQKNRKENTIIIKRCASQLPIEGKHDAMGYVSTCGGLGLDRHDVKEGRGWGLGKQTNNRNFSCARAFLECLVCDGWYCTCNTQNCGGEKNPLTQRKQKEKERA
jgi:hypothetical protein